MLGQHPKMYSIPEVNLFSHETMRERENFLRNLWPGGCSGLLRSVAQLWTGEQTIQTCGLAQLWVRSRLNSSCVSVMREIAEKVGDRITVEKSPDSARRAEFLQRCRRAFPRARYLHLTRHPRSQCKSVMQFTVGREEILETKVRTGIPIPLAQALNVYDWSTKPAVPDLQRYWFAFNTTICAFLAGLPKDQWMRIRGEDLLTDPDKHLPVVAEWLGLQTDREAVEAMKHPERSPFAGFGPINAKAGGDWNFFMDSRLRPFKRDATATLEGPLEWRHDGGRFSEELKDLAREFGYQ
jgi:hypothetical protein